MCGDSMSYAWVLHILHLYLTQVMVDCRCCLDPMWHLPCSHLQTWVSDAVPEAVRSHTCLSVWLLLGHGALHPPPHPPTCDCSVSGKDDQLVRGHSVGHRGRLIKPSVYILAYIGRSHWALWLACSPLSYCLEPQLVLPSFLPWRCFYVHPIFYVIRSTLYTYVVCLWGIQVAATYVLG